MQTLIRIQAADFDLQEEYRGLLARSGNTDVVAAFVGPVYDRDADVSLPPLFLKHYLEVMENEIAEIVRTASQRWPLEACVVVHYVDELGPNEQTVLVLVVAVHHKTAFAAAELIMDYLKTETPFWKKEISSDGLERWVEIRQNDREAAEKWGGTQ